MTFLFLLASCGDKEDRLNYVIATNFPSEMQVKGKAFASLDHYRIREVRLIDTFLVVVTPSDSNYIHVYSTESDSLLLKLSSRGRGPGEFLSADPIRAFSEPGKRQFAVFDNQTKDITMIDVIRSVNEDGFFYERFPNRISTAEGNVPVETIYHNSGERAVYRTEFDMEMRFSIFNYQTGEIINIPINYPNRSDYRLPEGAGQLSRIFMVTTLAVNTRLNRIASGPFLLGELDFFDLDGNYIATSLYANKDTIRKHIDNLYESPNSIHRYNSIICSDDDYVYVLNDNYRTGVLAPAPGESNWHRIPSPEAVGHSNELLVFDWNGRPVKRFLFDRFIRNFTIDYNMGVIFGVYNHPEDGDKIIEYRF